MWEFCGGNVKSQTTLVEELGIGFWTRVRLPSSPLNLERAMEIPSLFRYISQKLRSELNEEIFNARIFSIKMENSNYE